MTCDVNEMRPREESIFLENGEQCGSLTDFGQCDPPAGHIYDIGGSRLREILAHNLRNAITRAGPGRKRTLPSELFSMAMGWQSGARSRLSQNSISRGMRLSFSNIMGLR